MKTYYKGVTSIAAIFMTLILFSCQVEQIEPIDTLSTESNQNMSKPGNGNGGGGNVVYYNVKINNTFGIPWEGDILITDPNGCAATNNSKQTVVWFDNGCDIIFTTSDGTNLYLSFISMGKSPIDEVQVWMHDAEGNDYHTLWEDGNVESTPINPLGYTVEVNKTLNIFKKVKRKRTPKGTIRLGNIVMTPIGPCVPPCNPI